MSVEDMIWITPDDRRWFGMLKNFSALQQLILAVRRNGVSSPVKAVGELNGSIAIQWAHVLCLWDYTTRDFTVIQAVTSLDRVEGLHLRNVDFAKAVETISSVIQ